MQRLEVSGAVRQLYVSLGFKGLIYCNICDGAVGCGSIPDGGHWILHCLIQLGRTMALGSTQPLTEMSNGNRSWGGKGGRCVGLTTLPNSCAKCLKILGDSTSYSLQGLSRPV